MSDFHFLRPWWWLALLPLAVALWFWSRRNHGGGDWREYCDPALLPHILIGSVSRQSRQPLWLAGMTGFLAILALAGPAWERIPTPVFRNLSAMVIVLDLSAAMEAADVKPSRLERARFKIDDLLRARKDGQTALLAYAGDAFVVTPLTDDVATIAAQLLALTPGVMPVPGTRMDLGLAAAARLLQQAGQPSGDVLVVTAGDSVVAAKAEAARLKGLGYRVSVLGIGSRDGAPVPLPQGGFLKDAAGRIVVSRLDIKALWDLAQAGGGVYRTLDAGSADTEALLEFVNRRAAAGQQAGQDVHVEQWQEGGIWLLPIIVLLSALGFRRGWLGVLLLAALLPAPHPAEAFEWRNLWLTPDQQARRALEAGDARAAAERFENPAWKAAAEYQAGAFAEAAKRLEPIDTAAAQYNRGNALARQGQLEEALKAYDRALQHKPDDADAQYNRKLVEDALKKQQEEQEQQKPDKGDKGDKNQQGDQGQQPQPSPGDKSDQQQKSEAQNQNPSQNQPESAEQQAGQSESSPNPAESGGENPEAESQPDQQAARPGADQNHDQPEPTPPAAPSAVQPGEAKAEQSPTAAADADVAPPTESDQAEAQWLRRIPDDPGGLLKRKFSYQYRLRQQQQQHAE